MDLNQIKKESEKEINSAKSGAELEEARIKYLGRKGKLTGILRGLKDLSIEEKRKIGPAANALRRGLENLIAKKTEELAGQVGELPQQFDVTRPGQKIKLGHLHPLTRIMNEIRQIFLAMNFSVVEGPEVETEYYNFDALNIPPDHPARDMWDTFWLKPESHKSKTKSRKLLLRTHTSPMQIRYMEKHEPPIQIIVPGRVFRYEATDASHEINFYQVEGLMVGPGISLANFKSVVEHFFKKFFGPDIAFRFRPSYFPFTEPSLEVDVKFKGKWLEVMGAGMVHRNVFHAVKYNPNEVQGFAFGIGVERLAMIKYNIPDIRLFYSGDLRFINQF